jgi:chemotaxis protein methyltransferase CheR
MPMTPQDMLELAKLVKQLCGLALDDSKGYLVESRLTHLATDAGCTNYVDLCRRAVAGDRQLRTKIIDAITTHETLFFRDGSPFNVLQHRVIPDIIDSKAHAPLSKRIRFWCAACSTGQECYSIAIVLSELLPDIASWNINILGTDIADSSIAQASRGAYSAYEIGRGMPAHYLNKYMVREGATWKVRDPLRALVRFDRRNLLETFHDLGPFDVIFCRNAAIYFDQPTRQNLFLRLAEQLSPGGYLFVGASESLADLGPRFAPKMYCRSIFYQPNLATHTPHC